MLKLPIAKGTVHFLRGGGGGWWDSGGGSPKKKKALKGGPSKKNKGKRGSRKILPFLEGGRGKKFSYWGGVMQLSNDTSKNITSPPYLVKNERSLSSLAL